MKKLKRIDLETLKVKSFITTISNNKQVMGGSVPTTVSTSNGENDNCWSTSCPPGTGAEAQL